MNKRKKIEKTGKTEPKVKSNIRELRISLGVMIKENHLDLFKNVLLAEHLSNLSKPNYKIKKSLGYKKWFLQVLGPVYEETLNDKDTPFPLVNLETTYPLLSILKDNKKQKFLEELANLYEEYDKEKPKIHTKSDFYHTCVISAICSNHYTVLINYLNFFTEHIDPKQISDFFDTKMKAIFEDTSNSVSENRLVRVFEEKSLQNAAKLFKITGWDEILFKNLGSITQCSESTQSIFRNILAFYSGNEDFHKSLIDKLLELRKNPTKEHVSQKLERVFFESLINDSNIQFEVYLKEMYGSTVTIDNAFMFRYILGFLKALKTNSFDNTYINDFEDRWTNVLANLLNQTQEQKSIESIIQVIQNANTENGAVISEKMHRLLMEEPNYRKYYAVQPPLATTQKVVAPTLASIASNSQSIHLDPIENSCHEIAGYLIRKYSNQPSNINKFSEYLNRKTQEMHLSQLYSSAAIKDDADLKILSPEAFKKIAQIVMPERLLIQSMSLSKYANLIQNFPLAINNPYYTALRWLSLVTLNPVYKNFSVPFFGNLTAIKALQLICAAIHDPDCKRTDAQIESLYEIVISRMNDSIREYDHGNKLSADAPRCSKGLIQEILGSLSGATDDEQLNLKMITLDTLVTEIKEFYRNKFNQLDKNEQRKYIEVDDDNTESLSKEFIKKYSQEFKDKIKAYPFKEKQIDDYLYGEPLSLKEFITNNDVNDDNKENNDNNVPTPVTTTANSPSSLNFLPNKKQAIGMFNPVSKPRVVTQKDSMEKPQNVQAPTFFPPANTNNKGNLADFIELIHQVVLLDNQTQYKYLVSLIERGGFDINTPIFEGKTALHLGVLHNHYHLVDVLLKNGADRTIHDNDNKTIQDYYNENPKAHELLDAFFKSDMILN